MSNSTQFYESTKALIKLIIKNTEKENFSQSSFKKRKLSVPDNLSFKASGQNSTQTSDFSRTLNYTPVEKIFNVENARTNELLRSMMEKSNSVHVSPYISKSIGSHIKSQNDRSKRTKEIFKELRNNAKLLIGFNSAAGNIQSKMPSAPAIRNLSDIREKLKNSGSLIKSGASGSLGTVGSGISGSSGKIFGKEFGLNVNSSNSSKVCATDNLINNNNLNAATFLDLKNISSFNSGCSSATKQGNESNLNALNCNNLFSSSVFIGDNINKTPVFRQIDKSNWFNYTPENNNVVNYNYNNFITNSSSNKINLANSSESLANKINNNNDNSDKDNSNNKKEFLLSKNLSFNFTEQEKDNNNNNQNN